LAPSPQERKREENHMRERKRQVPSDAKQPVLSKRKVCLEQQANELLGDFIGISPEDALNIVLRKMANDADSQWRSQRRVPQKGSPASLGPCVNAENRVAA
jgi:hypothetical protein